MTVPTFIAESHSVSASNLVASVPPEENIVAGNVVAVGVKSKLPFQYVPQVSDDAGNNYTQVPHENPSEHHKEYAYYTTVVRPMRAVTVVFFDTQNDVEVNIYKVIPNDDGTAAKISDEQ